MRNRPVAQVVTMESPGSHCKRANRGGNRCDVASENAATCNEGRIGQCVHPRGPDVVVLINLDLELEAGDIRKQVGQAFEVTAERIFRIGTLLELPVSTGGGHEIVEQEVADALQIFQHQFCPAMRMRVVRVGQKSGTGTAKGSD